MRESHTTLILCLSISLACFLVHPGPTSVEAAPAGQAESQKETGWNLRFPDNEDAQAYQNFRQLAALTGTLFQGIDKARLFSKLEHRVWDVESNLYLKGEGLHTLNIHVDEVPAGEYNIKHRGPSEAINYVLSGKGYMLFQPLGQTEQKIDFEQGDLIAIPSYTWHQNFNTDPERPLRILAVSVGGMVSRLGIGVPPDPENDRYAQEAKERLKKGK